MSTRCPWVGELPIYIDYHDKEWGKPQFDSQKLFEKICLEGQPWKSAVKISVIWYGRL